MGRQIGVGVDHDVAGAALARGAPDAEMDGAALAALVGVLQVGDGGEPLGDRLFQEQDARRRVGVMFGEPRVRDVAAAVRAAASEPLESVHVSRPRQPGLRDPAPVTA